MIEKKCLSYEHRNHQYFTKLSKYLSEFFLRYRNSSIFTDIFCQLFCLIHEIEPLSVNDQFALFLTLNSQCLALVRPCFVNNYRLSFVNVFFISSGIVAFHQNNSNILKQLFVNIHQTYANDVTQNLNRTDCILVMYW